MAAALAVTDELVLPLRAVEDLAAAAEVSREEVVVITQCASLLGEFVLFPFWFGLDLFCQKTFHCWHWHGSGRGKLPFDDASVGAVLSVVKNVESFGDQLVAEINRVLQAGGILLVQSITPSSNQKEEYLNC